MLDFEKKGGGNGLSSQVTCCVCGKKYDRSKVKCMVTFFDLCIVEKCCGGCFEVLKRKFPFIIKLLDTSGIPNETEENKKCREILLATLQMIKEDKFALGLEL